MAATIFQSLVPGKTWRTGPRAPSDSVGINGDFWLNDSNGDIYEKIAGTYVLVPLPSGGGVTSFNGRVGAVVPQAGDYTASDVGLGNVTNDAQLKRSAGDFASFASKATLASADILLIEDSAAANAKKQTTVASLPGTAGASPYIKTPVSPNAFDDEFDSGSADLAVRGYTVVSGGTALTRAADIDPWNTTGPVGNTYWSTLIDSWLFVQGAPGVQIDIYKTVALTAGDTYFARMSGTFYTGAGGPGRFSEVGLYGASGASLDNNNRVFATVHDDLSPNFLLYDLARITGGVFGGTAGRSALGGHDIRGVHFTSGTDHMVFFVDANNGEVKSANVSGTPAAATLTRFGIRNYYQNVGSAVPQIWGIDFIRAKSGGAWLIP